MNNKSYVVTDIGLGDGGKGSVVQALTCKLRPHTIIKRGGGQGHHGVCTSRGEKFAFRNWGCGSFSGVPTHISEQFTIQLEIMRKEAGWLRYEQLLNPFDMLTVDERALMATELHMIASRLKEMARKDNPRGTVGTGVGVANRIHQTRPDLSIFAADISKHNVLRSKLLALREYLQDDLKPVLDTEFSQEDAAEKIRYENKLYDDGLIDFLLDCFGDLAKDLKVVPSDYMGSQILTKPGITIVETSHGVLGDAVLGYQPHTTSIRTVPSFTNDMLRKNGFTGTIINLAVHRAYSIRHGAGPLPTADPAMNDLLLPGSSKEENRWQGKVRVGPLDFVQMRKALTDSFPIQFDGLVLTWFDQIIKNGSWHFCDHYLSDDTPVIEKIAVPQELSSEKMFDFVAQQMAKFVTVPVRMVSFGPTEKDKVFK